MNRFVTVSVLAAGLMMAHQVAGKAARDSIYLSTFPVSELPKIVIAAAAAALVLTLLASRAMGPLGPRRVVPAGFLLSAGLHAVEWWALERAPGIAAIAVYIHIVGFGAILLSGFWSIASEAFDPASAKQYFGRIAGGGTVGGILGGLAAERAAMWLPAGGILLVLGGLHLLCGVTLGAACVATPAAGRGEEADGEAPLPGEVFRRTPFLRDLALMVLLGTAAAAFIDYLFKAGAAGSFERGAPLLRFFAVYYTAVQVVTLMVQTQLARRSLESLGLSRTVGSLPMANAALAGTGLIFPAFPVFAAARGVEYTLRGSLFRSGYELLYTPVAPADKRAAKTLIDVGADRAGDALGAGIIQGFLLLGGTFLKTGLLGMTVLVSLGTLWISRRLDRNYTEALESRLLDHAMELDMAEIHDSTTMSAVLRTRTVAAAAAPMVERRAAVGAAVGDPTLERLAILRSGRGEAVIGELRREAAFDPLESTQIVRLLAWDAVAGEARRVLEEAGGRLTGQLSDRLLDPGESFAIRRRIPRILARQDSQRAFAALLEGLADSRFEVRYQCARALDFMHARNPALRAPRELVMEIVAGELRQGERVLQARRLLEEAGGDAGLPYLDPAVGEGADKNAEFVVSLLATILPREPLQVAFRAFHSSDRLLRGLAVEYFDSVLEGEARELFRKFASAESTPGRTPQSILKELQGSMEGPGLASRHFSQGAGKKPPTEA